MLYNTVWKSATSPTSPNGCLIGLPTPFRNPGTCFGEVGRRSGAGGGGDSKGWKTIEISSDPGYGTVATDLHTRRLLAQVLADACVCVCALGVSPIQEHVAVDILRSTAFGSHALIALACDICNPGSQSSGLHGASKDGVLYTAAEKQQTGICRPCAEFGGDSLGNLERGNPEAQECGKTKTKGQETVASEFAGHSSTGAAGCQLRVAGRDAAYVGRVASAQVKDWPDVSRCEFRCACVRVRACAWACGCGRVRVTA